MHFASQQSPAFGRAGDDVARLQSYFSAKFFERDQVKINRTRTNSTTAGERNFCFTKAREQRSEREHGRTHGPD